MIETFAVCPECRGTGYGDGLGDVTEMIREDPDFADDYRAGAYNTGCRRCGGQRVVPACRCGQPVQEGHTYVPILDDEGEREERQPYRDCYDHLPADQRDELHDQWQIDAESAAERRMGA